MAQAGAGFCDFVASFYKTKPIPVVSTDKLQLQKELLARISELELEIKKLKDRKNMDLFGKKNLRMLFCSAEKMYRF